MVTEFFDGAEEIGDAEVDDQVIDEGLALIRRLWDAGIAHRDIKPANLLVLDGHLHAHRRGLRPGPPVAVAAGGRPGQHDAGPGGAHRRRAGLPAGAGRTSPPTRSPRRSPRRAASPARPQLRTLMKRDGRDLVAQFRALAPPRGADLVAAVGSSADPPGRRAAGRRVPRPARRVLVVHAGRVGDRRRAGVRHRRRDDPDGPGGAVGRLPCHASTSFPAGWEATTW